MGNPIYTRYDDDWKETGKFWDEIRFNFKTDGKYRFGGSYESIGCVYGYDKLGKQLFKNFCPVVGQ